MRGGENYLCNNFGNKNRNCMMMIEPQKGNPFEPDAGLVVGLNSPGSEVDKTVGTILAVVEVAVEKPAWKSWAEKVIIHGFSIIYPVVLYSWQH